MSHYYKAIYEYADNVGSEREIIYKCSDDIECMQKVLVQVVNITMNPKIGVDSILSNEEIKKIAGTDSYRELAELIDNSENEKAFVYLIERDDNKIIYKF